MNRRAFLARLGFGTVAAAAAATGALDLERLLWTPGEKTIFLPPAISPLAEAFTMGDVFTIEGVYHLDTMTYKPTSELKLFLFTHNVSGVLMAETVHPRIITAGPYMNVSRSPVVDGKIDGRRVKPVMVGRTVAVATFTG